MTGPRGPTAGLTVETLAALLMEGDEVNLQGIGARHEAYYWKLAAWLLPRLGLVSPGAAARVVPLRQEFREALALFQEAAGGVAVGSAHFTRIRLDNVLSEYERALRAALAAADT